MLVFRILIPSFIVAFTIGCAPTGIERSGDAVASDVGQAAVDTAVKPLVYEPIRALPGGDVLSCGANNLTANDLQGQTTAAQGNLLTRPGTIQCLTSAAIRGLM